MASDPVPSAPAPVRDAPMSPPGATEVPGKGVYWVGRDIPAGLYRTTDSGADCSWWVAKDAAGTQASILAGAAKRGSGEVMLPSGAFFSSHQCAAWRRVAPPAT